MNHTSVCLEEAQFLAQQAPLQQSTRRLRVYRHSLGVEKKGGLSTHRRQRAVADRVPALALRLARGDRAHVRGGVGTGWL